VLASRLRWSLSLSLSLSLRLTLKHTTLSILSLSRRALGARVNFLLRRSNKFNLDNGGAKRAREFLSPCSPYFSAARENRNKFTWVARQAANICLWVPAAAFGVDRIAVMGFNLIGSLVGSSSATFDQSEKRANNKLVNSCSLCVVHSVGRFAALANYLKQLPLSQPQSTSVIAPSDARHCCSLIAPQTARSCQTRSLSFLSSPHSHT